MARKYTKIEILTEEVFRRKAKGETNREIAESYGLSKNQIKQLVARQNQKKRAIANGYVPLPKGFVYLCAVMDLCGRKALAWRVGNDMTTTPVTDTIREAGTKEKVTDGLALHSDQGSQYTSQAYFDLTQEYHVSPSMSSPGCPYDNAAMENFFGILKTECLYRAHFSSRPEVEQLVSEYIDFYNFERISLKNGLTPVEIRSKAA